MIILKDKLKISIPNSKSWPINIGESIRVEMHDVLIEGKVADIKHDYYLCELTKRAWVYTQYVYVK